MSRATATSLPPPRPRIVLTLWRSIAIVTVCYAGTALGIYVLIQYIEHVSGKPDPHRDLVVGIATLACCFAWAWSVVSIARDRR